MCPISVPSPPPASTASRNGTLCVPHPHIPPRTTCTLPRLIFLSPGASPSSTASRHGQQHLTQIYSSSASLSGRSHRQANGPLSRPLSPPYLSALPSALPTSSYSSTPSRLSSFSTMRFTTLLAVIIVLIMSHDSINQNVSITKILPVLCWAHYSLLQFGERWRFFFCSCSNLDTVVYDVHPPKTNQYWDFYYSKIHLHYKFHHVYLQNPTRSHWPTPGRLTPQTIS